MSKKLNFSNITFYSYELAQAFHMLTPAENLAIRVCAYSLPENPIVVNIGAGTGTSSLSVVESRSDAVVTTIDISPGGPLGGLQNEVNGFSKNGVDVPFQILDDSKNVGNNWKKWGYDLVDMLIIDGDHSEEGCRGDFDAWIDNVKPGGLILFHDYDRDVWPYVAKVVDSLDGITMVLVVDTIYIARKSNPKINVESECCQSEDKKDDKPIRTRRNKTKV